MILVKLLSTQQDFERLRCSKKLMIYVYSFYQNSENETPIVVLINENADPFLVINEPFDHEFLWDDHKFWREIDRLSIRYDEDYSEELLKYYTQEKKDWRHKDDNYLKFTEMDNPIFSVYREEDELVSCNKAFKEQMQADFALLLESVNKCVLIYCSGAANVKIIDNSEKIREILAESNVKKVNDKDLFS